MAARTSWIEISRGAYARNVAAFRALGTPALGAVLKANAYGHGFTEILSLAHSAVEVLYVIRPDEALDIRAWEERQRAPRRRVVVLGAVDSTECVALAAACVQVAVGDRELAAAAPLLRTAKLTLEVHLHIDSGLGREGFTPAQLQEGSADFLFLDKEAFRVVGSMSHFANTEDVTEQTYADGQLQAFRQGTELFENRSGLARLERHIAASAAALVMPDASCDVLRVGISLYGLWPSAETRLSTRVVRGTTPNLEPVLTWRVHSQLTKWLPAGSYVGYGCTHRCGEATRIAVLPVGYSDGYPRLLSGKAHVLVHGQRCPVLGRVMMNHLIVDVTRVPSREEPLTATLLGHDRDEHLGAETIARWAETINYEIVARLGSHLPRRIVP